MPTRGPVQSQRPVPALPPELDRQLTYVLRHRLLRELPQAVAALAPLLAAAPHHPAVVTEAVRLRLEQGDFAGALRLGQEERAAQRDSLLVARELAYAAERLGRPAEAAGVVLEAWAASPTVTGWAQETLLRLAAATPGEARERMRRVARARPGRPDLALAAALLDARAGDLRGALAGLAAAERPAGHASSRWGFAQELLELGAPGDSAAAIAALTALAGDARFAAAQRLAAGQRAWELQLARGQRAEAAPALAQTLRDVPSPDWPPPFLAELARALREAGRTDEARALLGPGEPSHDPRRELDSRRRSPTCATARPRARCRGSPAVQGGFAGAWHQAEALFFAGETDSAMACYQRIVAGPSSPFRAPRSNASS